MQAWIRTALVGTANSPGEARPVAEIDALLPEGTREQRLLWQAGSMAVYGQAGRLPASVCFPDPAPEDATPATPHALTPIIAAAIAGELGGLPEWLAPRIAQAGRRLPAGLVPGVFATAQTLAAWLPVIGARGHWLGAQNPEWRAMLASRLPAAIDDSALLREWEEGDTAARRRALGMMRERDPAMARDLLIAALPGEKAEQRRAFVDALAATLTRDDEPFLESLLDDRSQVVRQSAATLLARLPDSSFMLRMAARADACVRWEAATAPAGTMAKLASFLGQRAQPRLTVDAPAELPKDWERDGIAATPPSGEGKRAFWLRQLLAVVPPSRWPAAVDEVPDVLIGLMAKHEWAEALLCGSAEAACRYGDTDWALALLPRAGGEIEALARYQDPLWRTLACVARDADLCRELMRGNAGTALRWLRELPGPWSSMVVSTIAQTVQTVLAGAGKTGVSDELMLRFDLAEMVELALLRAQDADLAQLAGVVGIYTAKLAEGPTDTITIRNLNRARDIVTLAQAKQTVIKEMPL
ncbi:DUF5691 domain-containing protein [Cupriavidus sp. PET2-C1]